jgi:glycosyltransferase involved in cell wall biosynthesis
MIIGIDTSALNSEGTGTGSYIKSLLNTLKAADHDIIEFSPENKSFVRLVAGNKSSGRGIPKHVYRLFYQSGKMINAGVQAGIFPDYFIARGFTKPAAIVIHDLSFITHPRFYNKRFIAFYTYQLKETLKHEPIIITVSDLTKKQIVKHLNQKAENIRIVQGYSDLWKSNNNSAAVIDNTESYLLYVGHVEPRKNLKFLIKNFLEWKKQTRSNLKLYVAGRVWIVSKEIKRMLKEYSGHPEIRFFNYVEESELIALYKNASGFVHTSLVEGFCFPIIEAMDFGLPILCSEETPAANNFDESVVRINPYNDQSMIAGLNELNTLIQTKSRIEYRLDYSSALMREQLEIVLDKLKKKVFVDFYFNQPASVVNNAVEKTLLYSSLFNGGLSFDELNRNLFDIKCSPRQLSTAINLLLGENKIINLEGNLKLNLPYSIIYEKRSKKLSHRKAGIILNFISKIPFISMIAFSGGTAHYGITEHDDIDLFIITKPYMLYIVYSIIHLGSLLLGIRKELCANFLVDENSLDIEGIKDFFVAHQIISLIPFKNKEMLNYFMLRNSWVKEFFPNVEISSKVYPVSSKFFVVFRPFNLLLGLLYKLKYGRIAKRLLSSSVIVKEHYLKLHTNDHRNKIVSRFIRECENYQNACNMIHESEKDELFDYSNSELERL